MAYSKLVRARSNCYKDGEYGGNAYRGSRYVPCCTTFIYIIFVECRGFNDFENLVTTSSSFECEVMELCKHKDYSLFSNALEASESYALFLSFDKDERMDSGTNLFKKRQYGMTRDKHENMKIFQGPGTRSRARKLEEENEEMVALLRGTFKIIHERHWKRENEDQRSTKTFLISIM
ncbi:hypothetical protein M9H77_17430 [Catharanthus roseus]|uniref:Uncharacterized protein n=1 Tax=Catharanthus roseus TaxID=4058 RepID=A0ACC0B4K3_CATRO|nr:hypothetical protein M9H77_17430 [Catharanthus roseus]